MDAKVPTSFLLTFAMDLHSFERSKDGILFFPGPGLISFNLFADFCRTKEPKRYLLLLEISETYSEAFLQVPIEFEVL